jgi:hypothetical protein
MEASLAGPRGTNFPTELTWKRWLSGAGLVLLGCLNFIWPLPSLVVLASLLVLLLFLIRPYVPLALAIFMLGFLAFSIGYFSAGYSYSYGIGYYMAVLGLLCWCPARLAGLTPPYQATTLDLPLLIVVVTCIISVLWTPFPNDGRYIAISMTMSYGAYLLICALNNTPWDLERLFWLWFALGILIVITTVATFFFKYEKIIPISDYVSFSINLTQFNGTRETLRGFVGAPKATASLLNVAILCGLTLLCTSVRRLVKVLIFFSLLSMLFIQILTISRLEMAGLFLGWLTFVHLHPGWQNVRVRQHVFMAVSVFVVLLAVLAMLSMFYGGGGEFLARIMGQEQTAGTGYKFSGTQNRREHIEHALSATWDTGGIGAGAAGIMRQMDPSAWIVAPSLYFSYLTDHGYGILSLILMGWIMINVILELYRAVKNCPDPRFKLFIIGVCSILVMFGSPLGDYLCFIFYHWAILAFVAVAAKAVRHLVKSPT